MKDIYWKYFGLTAILVKILTISWQFNGENLKFWTQVIV